MKIPKTANDGLSFMLVMNEPRKPANSKSQFQFCQSNNNQFVQIT